MANKPLLCAGSVVRNILSGRQTQDRRPIRDLRPLDDGRPSYPQYPIREVVTADSTFPKGDRGKAVLRVRNDEGAGWYLPAPWSPGDVLYVRETWTIPGLLFGNPGVDPEKCDRSLLRYRADGDLVSVPWLHPADKVRPTWRPSIHMPKWAARLHLTVLTVTVERVNAISEDDARAEGCETVAEFAALWDSLYGAGSFDRGDWCWVTRFEVPK